MTREEAIKEIQDASDYEVRHGDIEHHHEDIMRRVEAFEKAVNALQKEPVYFPPCVDCNTKMNEIREAYDNLKKQEPSEWQQDHAILKAHSDGANEVIDRIKEARQEMTAIIEHCLLSGASIKACGLREARDIIDKLIAEVEGKDATERK